MGSAAWNANSWIRALKLPRTYSAEFAGTSADIAGGLKYEGDIEHASHTSISLAEPTSQLKFLVVCGSSAVYTMQESNYCKRCNRTYVSRWCHYEQYHRRTVTVSYLDGHAPVTVHRDPVDGKFECVMCHRRYPRGKSLAFHGLHGCPATTSTTYNDSLSPRVDPAEEAIVNAAQPRRVRQNPRRGLTPIISRTKRAMVRRLHREGWGIVEITEHLNIDERAARYAIDNGASDYLRDDQDYLDGEVGDVINVDSFSPPISLKSDDEVEVVAIFRGKDKSAREDIGSRFTRRRSLFTNTPHARSSGAVGSSSNQGVQRETASNPERSAFRQAHASNIASSSSNYGLQQKTPSNVANTTISKFLDGLIPALGTFSDALADLGVKTEQDLRALCCMQHRWEEARAFLQSKGMTTLQWWVLMDALNKHARL